MNRRGFITGLGALLATSSLVKPEAVVTHIVKSAETFTMVVHPSMMADLQAEWSTVQLDRLIYFLGGDGTVYSYDTNLVEWSPHGSFASSDFHDFSSEDLLRDL